uniref:Uncharacterized protein n=1 Tax=Rhizophora mucronata TaxID=61149 RepID=A0A2P2P7V6_RHIMU
MSNVQEGDCNFSPSLSVCTSSFYLFLIWSFMGSLSKLWELEMIKHHFVMRES